MRHCFRATWHTCNNCCHLHSQPPLYALKNAWFTTVSALLSLYLHRISDLTPSPLGADKLKISWPSCVKPFLPDWMKLPGGLTDSDKLTMTESSTPHFQLWSTKQIFLLSHGFKVLVMAEMFKQRSLKIQSRLNNQHIDQMIKSRWMSTHLL